ncbi:unnamed protein product [Brassicogethes aeneus]|uniref:Serine aminopeptidase S33 domain-containing protein n=1 Tax=Brassicogethes aeneus TaxID=1431903 RepID=A0A9P0AU52_BRAAE|nr:unnamed protein product [Brassicogethes aeneus]
MEGLYIPKRSKPWKTKLKKAIFIILITLFILLLIALIAVFVVLPLVFMNSLSLQKKIVFTNSDLNSNKEFYETFPQPGFKNRYIIVKDLNGSTNVSIGLWQMLPTSVTLDLYDDYAIDYDYMLKNSTHDILIYFHGTGESRDDSVLKYRVFRHYFQVIAFDYRGYADSTRADLTEASVVSDCIQIYKWVLEQTNAKIFVYGHSLGTALATRMIAHLSKENISPVGLILESPFTSFLEEIAEHKYGKLFAWLPYFKATIINPLEKNGFTFDTKKYILNTTCPIMFLHAEDDDIVPIKFTNKLSELANLRPNSTVVVNKFDAKFEYNHYSIYKNQFYEYMVAPGLITTIILPTELISKKNYSIAELPGVNNFYVKVNEKENITLGVWEILPRSILRDAMNNNEYDYERILKDNNQNVLIYLHGNAADRTEFAPLYNILREDFHIFAVDYRGYGDSFKGEMTETKMVDDIFQFYKWLHNKTSSNIYVWGHSLGTAIGTHLVSNLKNDNLTTTGLILEAPFTSVPEVVSNHTVSKLISWVPWYEWTILDPFVDNDIAFQTEKYVTNVDCPIMILHSKDDSIISYLYATRLFEIAQNNRDFSTQGVVRYHLFPEDSGYDHMEIYKEPFLIKLVENFIEDCEKFKKHKWVQ